MASRNLYEQVLRAALRKLDGMDGEQLLAWLDANKPAFACERRPEAYLQRARAHAFARLDALTS
jgi:hypothetical protein